MSDKAYHLQAMAHAAQALMRHKSYQTTQVYINLARQLDDAVNVLHVPDVLKGQEQPAPKKRKRNA